MFTVVSFRPRRPMLFSGAVCAGVWLALAGFAGAISMRAEAAGVPDAGFEEGAGRWDFGAAQGTAKVVPDAAFAGRQGLRVESTEKTPDALIASARIPVEPGVIYQLGWQARVVAGAGTNVYLRFFDAGGKALQREEGRVNNDKSGQWAPGQLSAIPPEGAATMDVAVQRPNWRPSDFVIDIDAFELTAAPLPVAAPWPGTYKLRADETERLTAADVAGPDGRVYPDFTWAGVPGGIPRPSVALRLEDKGARPGADISGLLEQAAAEVGAKGGGAITLGAGTFYLDAPVMIFADKVVIRGEGPEKTRLLFRYHVPMGEIRFFRLQPGQELGPNGGIEFHANPKDLVALELRVGDKRIDRRTRQDHWGNTFLMRVGAGSALNLVGEGEQTFTAIAEYADGAKVERTIALRLSRTGSDEPAPNQLGAINFAGRGNVSARIPLLADGRRGGRVLRLAARHGLAVGDKISLVAPASERWKKLVGHASHWAIQAQNFYEIAAVEGDTVTIHQSLRVDFLAEDGSFLQKIRVVASSGVEGLTLEQVEVPGQGAPGPVIGATLWHAIEDLWISGVTTQFAWGCWLENVVIRNTGRNAAYFPMSKHIEIRDCLFDEAIFKGGGGTGYVGFDRSWDCLMDQVETRGMRHAPNNQWNASGNVVRNGRFLGSDAQWHTGWTHENLYENNFIDARGDGGSYGHGFYASGPSSGIHGPSGPRNVVYNNDVVARKDCLHMLGGNEAWLILHNRFVTDNGRAVFAKEKSFDHVIAGNVFVLRRAVRPPVQLGTDSVGVELVDNAFYGVTPPLVRFAGGLTKLALDRGNVAEPEVPARLPDRPQPAVPSIYQWQRDHQESIRATQAAAEARR
ncbi:MAG: endopolygalacturonase [Burkholderiales bacterium]|nr:endopolygalacturonase [Opitutaceae bacterium]